MGRSKKGWINRQIYSFDCELINKWIYIDRKIYQRIDRLKMDRWKNIKQINGLTN